MASTQGFDVSTVVPSTRDLLQAVRTGKRSLALLPRLVSEDSAREALRMAEFGVAAIAMSETGPAMAAAAQATRLPFLSLQLVRTREVGLASRAYGADAVIVDPALGAEEWEQVASAARSTRMVALPLAKSRAAAERLAEGGAKAIVVQAPDAAGLADLASGCGRAIVIAWPTEHIENEADLASLRGKVDAVVVDVEVYGEAGFERLVSELGG